MLAVGLLRLHLLRLHTAAAAAIKPGMSLDAWHTDHFGPLVDARVDAWLAVARDATPEIERAHVRLRADFYAREDELLARAEAAAKTKPVKPHAPRRGRTSPLSLDAI